MDVQKRGRLVWVGDDDVQYPVHLGNGSMFVLQGDSPHEPGLYLPDGTWKPLPKDERRIGFG